MAAPVRLCIGCLYRPYRRQASSHRYGAGHQPVCVLVGCTGPIAGKPAPTGMVQAISLFVYRLAAPALSPASQLPQVRRRPSACLCTGWLHRPYRRQASSHRYGAGHQPVCVPVGCTGPIAGKPAATGKAQAISLSVYWLAAPALLPASQLPQVRRRPSACLCTGWLHRPYRRQASCHR